MAIDYHKNDYNRAERANIETTTYGFDQLNGNIKGIRWNNGYQPLAANAQNTYQYNYNRNYWLTEAKFGHYTDPSSNTTYPVNITKNTTVSGTQTYEASNSITLAPGFHAPAGSTITAKIIDVDGFQEQNGDYDVTGITYDENGNIQTLNRNKNTESGSNAMDKLSYTYKTDKPNQLLRVDDAVTTATNADDIKDQNGTNYIYNQIGQLTENTGEGIKYTYNANGLVTEVKKNNVSLVKFFYNDRGHRVKKEKFNSLGNSTGSTYYVRDVSGQVMAIYHGTTAKEYPVYGLTREAVFYRRSDLTSSVTSYQLTDHLGNVRAVIVKNGTNAASITTAKDYYPGGSQCLTEISLEQKGTDMATKANLQRPIQRLGNLLLNCGCMIRG